MARSRSRSRSPDRRHSRHSAAQCRSRSRSRSRGRHHSERSRDSERHRHRSKERDERISRHSTRPDSKEHQRRRSRSTSREDTERGRRRRRSASPQQPAPAPAVDEQALKRQRLEAWRAKQQQQQPPPPKQPIKATTSSSQAAATADAQPKVWMPWEEDAAAPAAADAQAAAHNTVEPNQQAPATTAAAWMPWENPSPAAAVLQPAQAPAPVAASAPVASTSGEPEAKSWDYVPAGVAVKKARAAAEDLQEMLAQAAGEEDEDPLEAFMSAQILPEVKAREEEERRAKEAERLKLAKDIAEGKAKLPTVEDDSEEEETPDLELQIPTSKVKLVIGPGGTKIGEIQKKSKARLQVKKEEEELNVAFGAGPAGLAQAKAKAGAAARNAAPRPGSAGAASDVAGDDSDAEGDKAAADNEPKRRMTTIMIFGEAKAIEIAVRMIDEAVSNKEQKAKQRQKEYERKRDAKRRERQLYHMRHARDYEALGLQMGASKADVKKAHRKLAVQWHPDKHPTNKDEATAKFQEIQKAYDSLMSTNEDDHIGQLEK